MAFELTRHEILVDGIVRNASPARLYEDAVVNEQAAIASSGALHYSLGQEDRPQPEDKRIVEHPDSSARRLVGPVNIKLDEQCFHDQPRARDRLSEHAERLYVCRRLRRLGPALPPQGSRDLCSAVSRRSSCTTC